MFCEVNDFGFVFEVGDVNGEFGAELAVDLDHNFNRVAGEILIIPLWPFVVSAKLLEHFGGEVWGEGFQKFSKNN